MVIELINLVILRIEINGLRIIAKTVERVDTKVDNNL